MSARQNLKQVFMQNRMVPIKREWLRVVILLLVILGFGTSHGSGEEAKPEWYNLSVQLHDPLNHDFEIRLTVKVGKRFQAISDNGAVRNKISGVLHSPEGNTYPLTLEITEFASQQNNNSEKVNLQLELDKPWSGGPVASLVYLRTIRLTKLKRSPPGLCP
ncbi:MAG: hypothetical protein K1Y36_13610 [Blastocatellia bacterium]|nr:hypothetical protein [Blastocatellia bacterium]